MLADTHCHLDLPVFDPDRQAVIQRAAEAGVARILMPSLNVESAVAVLSLTKATPHLYAAVGVHPTESTTWTDSTPARLRQLAEHDRVVAIGEIGLDYFWDAAPRATQQQVLREQLAVAEELGLPVIIHCREPEDATDGPCIDDLLALLTEWAHALGARASPLRYRPGVLHSFSGSARAAAQAMQLGFCIGVTGPITYKNAVNRREMVASLVPERILLETDAPYLAPVPHRGRRNEPAFLVNIADKIAEMKGSTHQQVASLTSNNAARLFGWDTVS